MRRVTRYLVYLANIASLSRFIISGLLLYFSVKFRNVRVLMLPLVLIIGLMVNLNINDDRTTFQGKIASSLNELTVNSSVTDNELHGQWRGYEIMLLVQKTGVADLYNKFVGFGYGSKLALDREWELDGQWVNDIPRLHNAFLTVVLKSGFLGFVVYLILVFQYSRDFTYHKNMRVIVLVLLIIQSFVFAGIFSPEMMLFNFLTGVRINEKIFNNYRCTQGRNEQFVRDTELSQ